MIADIARTGAALRCLVLALAVAAGPIPTAQAAPAAASATDLAAFDKGFRAGQEEFERGEYLVAARSWTVAAGLLPETAEHKENRRAIHEYIAEAYGKAAAAGTDDETVREGLKTLDAYAEGFVAAYPKEALPAQVEEVRTSFRARLTEAERAAKERAKAEATVEEPAPFVPPPPPPAKPWKGLAIGGGISTGVGVAMLGMFAVGLARARQSTAAFDDPANMCDLSAPIGKCADIDGQGRRANAIAVAGLVSAPLLIGAGIAMLVVAKRRKAASTTALAPSFGRGMVGLVWQQRF